LNKHFIDLLTPLPHVVFLGYPTSPGLLNTKIEKSYNFKIFLNVFENDNEKLEVLNSFLKLNFNRKSAAPKRFRPGPVAPSHPPLLRH